MAYALDKTTGIFIAMSDHTFRGYRITAGERDDSPST